MTRELILLSPYRLPAQNTLMLSNEDVAAFLNGYTALWHPAAVLGAASAPCVASPYDHEQPTAGHVYAVPDSPPLVLPDDWEQRVRDAGAVSFKATPDRAATVANLLAALRAVPAEMPQNALFDLPAEQAAAFYGVGFGYLVLEGLTEAMEHQNLLDAEAFWKDMQSAVSALGGPEADAYPAHLKSAAERLLSAREVLYPVTIHMVDICLLDPQRLGEPLPASVDKGLPLNLVACAALLERFGREHPERLAQVRERAAAELIEVCGGPYREREDALLPLESQIANLVHGLNKYPELVGQEVRVFARKRFAAHPQLPLLLTGVGLHKALLVAFDDGVLPNYRATTVNWPSPDGKQVDAFTRAPYAADNPQTFFHAAHYLHRTIMQDQSATLALLHHTAPAAPWYEDWLELSRLAPVLGQWTTFSRYFGEVVAGEYASSGSADDFHGDYLSERSQSGQGGGATVSGFARHVRGRRRLDTAWTLAALNRGLAGKGDTTGLDARVAALEERFEAAEPGPDDLRHELGEVQQAAAQALADRLTSRAVGDNPGFLVLNPCSFTRRVVVEADGLDGPPAVEGPVKASQFDGGQAKLVVEVPALGFAWFPRAAAAPQKSRMRLADDRCVRNEFFEAEVDATTGGLKAIRDHRTRLNRLGQQLVYNPGSTARVKGIKVTSAGPALGEVVSEGALLDDQERVLATFRQRFRAWLGRPLLEMRVEIFPEHKPAGYPWHSYYGARFAWRDERATLLRGVNGSGSVTSHTRPETPDYLELRLGRQATTIFPGGLPFHQRHGARMLDVILAPEGETATAFDLAVGMDRDYPMQTALGLVTPAPAVPTAKGPPHVGATGWLFHLDMPNVLLTSLRPAPDGADAVVARLLECSGHAGQAELRTARDPTRAVLLDARGGYVVEVSTQGDAAVFEVTQNDLVQVRVEFG